MKASSDLTRPAVSVTIPQVKLQLKDLAFLRSVGQPTAVRCFPGRSVIDKLRFLDLIARSKVPPSDEAIKVAAKEKTELVKQLQAAVGRENWDDVYNVAYSLRSVVKGLEPREDDVLTEKGKALLRNGEVNVKVRKVGCV